MRWRRPVFFYTITIQQKWQLDDDGNDNDGEGSNIDDEQQKDDGNCNDGEGSTLLLHSSLRDCRGNVQQSVSALEIVMIIIIMALSIIRYDQKCARTW